MTGNSLTCRDSQRRATLQQTNPKDFRWNGIDYVEFDAVAGLQCLRVELLCTAPKCLKACQFSLYSHELRQKIGIKSIGTPSGSTIILETETPLCDHASYTLTLSRPEDVDPQFANYSFTAVGDGKTEIDPKPAASCPPPTRPDPQLNYLARDYGTFRQLLLDRMALSMPDWRERHVPDIGIALVEALAYVGDYLAWNQDAVATEAYLNTARQRVSVRRHARLVDYQLHEGCNARTFLFVGVAGTPGVVIDPSDAYFVTKLPDDRLEKQDVIFAPDLERLPPQSYQAFEIVRPTPSCRPIGVDDVKNPVGLIAWLCDGSGQLETFLMRCFSADLVQEIVAYAAAALALPLPSLIAALAAALDTITQQYRLADHVDCTKVLKPDALRQWLGFVVDASRIVETNLAMLRHALEPFLAKAANRQLTLYPANNEVLFYTWNQSECCLPAGATKATLRDCAPGTQSCTATAPPCAPADPARDLAADPFAAASMRQSGDSADLSDGPSSSAAASQGSGAPYEERAPFCSIFAQAHRQQWNLQHLSPGDLLLFEETRGPRTHNRADADPDHRQVVRLTCVTFCIDPVTSERLVEIEWATDDALRFPLCISSVGPAETGCQIRDDISVARGNILLVDHGLRVSQPEWLGSVPRRESKPVCERTFCDDVPAAESSRRDLFRPTLKEADLTFAAPVTGCTCATKLLEQKSHQAVPVIDVVALPLADVAPDAFPPPGAPPNTIVELDDLGDAHDLLQRLPNLSDAELHRLEALLPTSADRILQKYAQGRQQQQTAQAAPVPSQLNRQDEASSFVASLSDAVSWKARVHLLDSSPEDRHFVVEIDNDRRTHLRFGDGDLSRRPPVETSFYANYRRGNGVIGNVGADTITHLVYRRTPPTGGVVTSVRNPVPAVGGVEPESLDHARQLAPQAFRKLRRCIIADDYAEIARRDFPGRVQQARASLNWMGTWYEVAVAIDPQANVRDREALVTEVRRHLEKHRRIGHLLKVELPRYVGLQIDMTVCVTAGYLRAHVQAELLNRFSNRILADGSRGFFHPDNFGFGDALYLSKLVAAAKKVPGVENVDITRFERRRQGNQGERDAGAMNFAPLEIPRLDNDPLRPENGCFCLDMQGVR